MISKVIFNNPNLKGLASINQSGEVIGFINFNHKTKDTVYSENELLKGDVQSHIENCIRLTNEMDNKIKSVLAS